MKSFFRFLKHNALFSLINFIGLTVSLAFTVYIGCYVWQQFHISVENQDRRNIYVLGTNTCWGLSYGLEGLLSERFPEIEISTNVVIDNGMATYNGNKYGIHALFADQDFFKLFPYYTLVEGNPEAIDVKENIFVSESFASRISTDGDIIGQSLKIYGDVYCIAGVFKDFKSTLIPYQDIIGNIGAPFNAVLKDEAFDHIGSCIPILKLRKNASPEDFFNKTEELCKEVYRFYGSGIFEKVTMTRLDKVFFTPMAYNVFNYGDKKQIAVLIAIAILLLLSAILNYVNLNSALTSNRAKEMATRRLLGSSQKDIVTRYLLESIAFTAVCTLFSILSAKAVTPVMNGLIAAEVPTSVPVSLAYIAVYLLLVVFIGIINALAPASIISKFKPVDVMNGKFRSTNKKVFSKIFIVFQATLTVILIVMSMVMESQYAKSLNRKKNADIENKFFIQTGIYTNYSPASSSMIDRLKELPCVKEACYAWSVPGSNAGAQYSVTTSGEEIRYRSYIMDSTAFRMLGFEKVHDFNTPGQNGVWFGESAFSATGFNEDFHDIDNTLAQRSGLCGYTAGVIRDFPTNVSNIGAEDYLFVAIAEPEQLANTPAWLIETTGDKLKSQEQIMSVYEGWSKEYFGYVHEPYHAGYIEDLYKNGLKDTENQLRLIEIFMSVAIMIALLGMVAMSIYEAKMRQTAVAVRKVFGSTPAEEVRNGVLSYLKLICIALAAGIPVSIWLSDKYLEQFIIKIDNYCWIFFAAAFLTVLVSFLSILWQTLASSRTNPAEVLKKE